MRIKTLAIITGVLMLGFALHTLQEQMAELLLRALEVLI